jgi:hypothetical protein
VVADVVAAIRNHGKLPPLSEQEIEQRRIANELYHWECQRREEQRAFEYRERQAEAEAIARAERAAEIAESNRKARLERQAIINQQVRDREIADLRLQTAQQRGWMNNVENAARNAVQQRYRQTLMGELDAMINPAQPQPPPEPEVIYVEAAEGSDQLGTSDFNPKLWMQKPRSWF